RRGPAPGGLLRQFPDHQRRRADAGLWRPRRCRGGRRPRPCLPWPRDRPGALPAADLAERQPALRHHATTRRPAGMSKRTLTVALIQDRDHGSAEANLANIDARVAEAAGRGAKLVLLQELHNGPYFCQHEATDRKSTRLNSSHVKISYAVFC